MAEYWSEDSEMWNVTDSGKMELTVVYSGKSFTAKYKDEEKCRSDIRNRIQKSLALGLIKKEKN